MGNFSDCLSMYFSTFNEKKARAWMKNLRHASWDNNLNYALSKFHDFVLNNKEDVHKKMLC